MTAPIDAMTLAVLTAPADTLATAPAPKRVPRELTEKEKAKAARRMERRLTARLDTGAQRAGETPIPTPVTLPGEQLAMLVQATRHDALEQKGERVADGFLGREGYTEWNAIRRAEILCALEGTTVTATVRHVETYATKRGARAMVAVTALVEVTTVHGTETVAVTGKARVVDAADLSPKGLDGLTVLLKLTDAGETRRGEPKTGLKAETVGLASDGKRVSIAGTIGVSRKVNVIAKALK